MLRRSPWSGRADAGGRVALHATVCVGHATCSVVLRRPGRSLFREPKERRHGQSRAGCRAVSRVWPLAGGSPQEDTQQPVSVVSRVSRHLGCRIVIARAPRVRLSTFRVSRTPPGAPKASGSLVRRSTWDRSPQMGQGTTAERLSSRTSRTGASAVMESCAVTLGEPRAKREAPGHDYGDLGFGR